MYGLNTVLTDAVRCFMDTVEDEEEADTDSCWGPWGAAEGGSPAESPCWCRVRRAVVYTGRGHTCTQRTRYPAAPLLSVYHSSADL